MNAQFKFSNNERSTALVIVFPPGVNGLFNPGVHGLVREVQERLDGVYVTYALSSGNSPDLRAAMDAALFVGCESAVVVPTAASDLGEFLNRGAVGDWLLSNQFSGPDVDAPAVVDAYLSVVAEAGRAA